MTRTHRWWLPPLIVAALVASVAYFVAWGNQWSVAQHYAGAQAIELSLQSQSSSQRYAVIAVVLLVVAATGFAIWVGDRSTQQAQGAEPHH